MAIGILLPASRDPERLVKRCTHVAADLMQARVADLASSTVGYAEFLADEKSLAVHTRDGAHPMLAGTPRTRNLEVQMHKVLKRLNEVSARLDT